MSESRTRSRASARRQRLGDSPATDVEAYQVAVSTRIWVLLGLLGILLVIAAGGWLWAQNRLADAQTALREAQESVAKTELLLENALADKDHLIKELAAQGAIIAQSSRGEEKARVELEAAASEAQQAGQQVGALKAEIGRLKKRLTELRREGGDASRLRAELETLTAANQELRARLESALSEIERLTAAQPYSAPAVQPQATPAQ